MHKMPLCYPKFSRKSKNYIFLVTFLSENRLKLREIDGNYKKVNKKNAENKTQDVVQIVENILKKAVEAGASDIHFEPTESELVVKYRLDGVLKKIESLPKLLCDNVIARLKVLGNLQTYRNDIPQ